MKRILRLSSFRLKNFKTFQDSRTIKIFFTVLAGFYKMILFFNSYETRIWLNRRLSP